MYRFLFTIPFALFCFHVYSQTTPTMLAKSYKQDIDITQYLVSEKYDGIRARWDGRQYWSKQGNRLELPSSFYKNMPSEVIDGELWLGRNQFSPLVSLVKSKKFSNDDWRHVTFMGFDLPNSDDPFSQRYLTLKLLAKHYDNHHFNAVTQWKEASTTSLMQRLELLVEDGAEGLMLHHQTALYKDGRSASLLKLKLFKDKEAVVIGHIEGAGGIKGLMGAVLVKTEEGHVFKIGSGFSLDDRKTPPKIGSRITFRYRGLTSNGLPRFATYLRAKPAI